MEGVRRGEAQGREGERRRGESVWEKGRGERRRVKAALLPLAFGWFDGLSVERKTPGSRTSTGDFNLSLGNDLLPSRQKLRNQFSEMRTSDRGFFRRYVWVYKMFQPAFQMDSLT